MQPVKLLFKKESILLILLSIAYFLITSFHITILPIFTDESIHIYWAKLIATSNKQWFISLIDGEPPLFIWMMAILLKVFPSSLYLFAGRFAAVISGYIGFLGIYALTRVLFVSRLPATISAIFFILCPFFLFFDRIASYDALLSALGIWAIYFAVKTAQKRSFYHAFLWGIVLGLTLLSKASGIIFLPLSFISFFIFMKYQPSRTYLIKTFSLVFLVTILGLGIHSILFVSKGYVLYSTTGISKYTVSYTTFFQHPFIIFPQNFSAVVVWMWFYYPWFLSIIAAVGFLTLLIQQTRVGVLLLLLWGIPIMVVLFIGNGLYPRHILFTTPYIIIAASYSTAQLFQKHTLLIGIMIAASIGSVVYLDTPFLSNPANAVLPAIDYDQYISGYASGYGLDSAFRFLARQSQTYPINVITLGTVSSYPYAFMLEFWDNPRVHVSAIWPVEKDTRAKIIASQKQAPTFVILKVLTDGEHKNFLSELHLKTVCKADKPFGNKSVFITVPN